MAVYWSSIIECDRCKKQVKFQETKPSDCVPAEGVFAWAKVSYKPGGSYSEVSKLICNDCRLALDVFLANPELIPEPPVIKRRRFIEA